MPAVGGRVLEQADVRIAAVRYSGTGGTADTKDHQTTQQDQSNDHDRAANVETIGILGGASGGASHLASDALSLSVMVDDITGSGAAAAEMHLARLAGELPAGSPLPSTRALQQQFAISALTAQRVLAGLVRAGTVVVVPGRGSYVAEHRRTSARDLSWQTQVLGDREQAQSAAHIALLAPLPEGVKDLRLGYLDPSLQPTQLLAAATSRAARRPHVWDRTSTDGLIELRTLLAGEVGPHYGAGDVLITSGGQAALAVSFRALAQPGDTVVFEHLTYPGAVAAARAAGLNPVPVRADSDGVLPQALADVLSRTHARLVYLQPRYANPTGAVLNLARRRPVLDLLETHNAFCIEDDYVQRLNLTGRVLPTLAEMDTAGHVVHIQSLSKAVAPGVRIAGITSVGAATTRLRNCRIVDDLFVAPVVQQAALELLTSPGWARHLTTVRRNLTARRDALLAGLYSISSSAQNLTVPAGGLALWWPLPAGLNEHDIIHAAYDAGVAVAAGSNYTLGEPSGPALRLTYGRCPANEILNAGATIAQLTGAHAVAAADSSGWGLSR